MELSVNRWQAGHQQLTLIAPWSLRTNLSMSIVNSLANGYFVWFPSSFNKPTEYVVWNIVADYASPVSILQNIG
jgi:hypothetical protein